MRQPAYLLPQLLTGSAEATPEAVAIIDGEQKWTYRQLDRYSNQLARAMMEWGVKRGDRVGVYLDKSAQAVAALYGAMKAGAAYVPLDPGAPTERLRTIAQDCEIACLVTADDKDAWPEIVSELTASSVLLLAENPDTDKRAGVRPERIVTPADIARQDSGAVDVGTIDQDLAYILYTSGSTGQPKGVMLTHRNAMAFVTWAAAEFEVGPEDVLSSHAPFHFDLSVLDLYVAAAAGAAVVLVPAKLSLFAKPLVAFIDRHRISVWYSVPSILTLIATRGGLAPGDLPSLRTVLFAGEVFPTKFLRDLMKTLPNVRFANLYGPTETNVCTWYEVPPLPEEMTEPIPIGRAIANTSLYVVREDGSLAGTGEEGELWVRGGTVMRGYWGDEERTGERLVRDPFGVGFADDVYRTGDLVIPTAEGDLQFVGRRDSQVKSRGYRIELGDVEAAIYAHPAVRECAVVAVPDELISNRLYAYVVLEQELDTSDLMQKAGEHVPRYMIPESFVRVGELPRTSTGKVDRRALLSQHADRASAGAP